MYEDYCQRVTLSITPAPPEERRRRHYARGAAFDDAEARIREGRRLFGEPDDLNF